LMQPHEKVPLRSREKHASPTIQIVDCNAWGHERLEGVVRLGPRKLIRTNVDVRC
ncbi:hypothetical protein CEXT_58051, partial [Caerostris extrusa]